VHDGCRKKGEDGPDPLPYADTGLRIPYDRFAGGAA
jgi:hypothetical protein